MIAATNIANNRLSKSDINQLVEHLHFLAASVDPQCFNQEGMKSSFFRLRDNSNDRLQLESTIFSQNLDIYQLRKLTDAFLNASMSGGNSEQGSMLTKACLELGWLAVQAIAMKNPSDPLGLSSGYAYRASDGDLPVNIQKLLEIRDACLIKALDTFYLDSERYKSLLSCADEGILNKLLAPFCILHESAKITRQVYDSLGVRIACILYPEVDAQP